MPRFFLGYQSTRDNDAMTESGRVLDLEERRGDFSQTVDTSGKPVEIFRPSIGRPYPGNVIPPNDISPQATALLDLYPLPNSSGGKGYNYQKPVSSATHQDALQLRRFRFIEVQTRASVSSAGINRS